MVKSLELFFESYNKFFRSFFFCFRRILFNLGGRFAVHYEKRFVPALLWSIDHLFDNLSLGKKYCFEKKSGKRFEFWIQKSVRTLNGLRRQHHAIVSVLSGLSQKTLRTQLIF